MATNEIFRRADRLSVVVSNPTTPTSSGPCRFGAWVGVALVDEGGGGNDATKTTVAFEGVFDLSVKGLDDAGNRAVAVGDKLYYVDGDTPALSKKASGYYAGVALETVSSGATDTIRVALPGTPSAFMAEGKGFIPLPIWGLREIFTNDIGVVADGAAQGSGGTLGTDSTPAYERVNGATDKATRVRWAASNVDEVQWGGIAVPPDLDEAGIVEVHLVTKMSGATDTPTIDVQVFEGLSDTEMGAPTAALSSSLAEQVVALAASDISGSPLGFLNISLVPAAHGTDAIDLFTAWIEYTRR